MSDALATYYAGLEKHLRGLLLMLAPRIDRQAALDIAEFIDAGEYGLAFEVLAEEFSRMGE